MRYLSLPLSLLRAASYFLAASLLLAGQFAVYASSSETILNDTVTGQLPNVVEYRGVLLDGAGDVDGVAMTGVQGVTFALYAEQFGGTPLWIETQNVEADAAGNFTALLGSASAQGLPQELFTANQARWLGVQANVAGSAEQPRVLFVSVPYALKSGDAETLGGLPASAYLLASDASESSESANGSELSNDAEAGFIGTAAVTGGTPGTVAKFDADGVSLIDSALIESGGKIGLGTGPDYRLDMFAGDGAQNVIRVFRPGENIFNLATDGAENSILFLSDGTGAATIKLSTAGDTYLTGGNLGIGTQTPATALDVNGTVTATTLNVAGTATATAFVGDGSGLTNLPGGSGDITAVNAGTGMSGGGITGDVTLNVDTTVIQNRVASTCAAGSSIRAIAQDGTVTCETDDGGAGGGGTVTSVDSGTGLTGGPVTTSGTLSIDTAVVPQLATANSFTEAQSSLTGTGTAAVSGTHTAMTGKGVVGYMSSTTGVNFGGDFQTDSATLNAAAVRGIASSADLAAGVTYGGFFQSNSPAGVALLGEATANSGDAWGIIGSCSGTIGACVGVTGQAAFSSGILLPQRTGVWGDSISGYRVFATSFNNRALVARNDNSQTTLEIQNLDPNGALIVAFDDLGTQRFSVDSGGNTLIQGGLTVIGDSTVTGAKSASVELDTGEKVNAYAIESPESWFEDFGSGQLNSGRTTIRIDPMFAQTVNTNEDYYVFITPTAECNGLYVSQKSPGTFSVREMGGGESSASFDYRIVAHRKGYEDLRFGPTFMPEASQPAQASARVEPGSPRRGRR